MFAQPGKVLKVIVRPHPEAGEIALLARDQADRRVLSARPGGEMWLE